MKLQHRKNYTSDIFISLKNSYQIFFKTIQLYIHNYSSAEGSVVNAKYFPNAYGKVENFSTAWHFP
jgi:hypothetical protein